MAPTARNNEEAKIDAFLKDFDAEAAMAPTARNNEQAKIDAFLKDFDAEVKARVLHLKEQQKRLLMEIDNRYDMAIIKLPKAVRQMNWLLFFRPEIPKSPEVDNSMREEVAELENILAENLAAPKPPQKSSKKARRATSSSEDENTAPQRTTKKGKSKTPPVKKTRVQSVLGQSASTRKSTRKPLVIPARNMLDSSSLMMGDTPLITPCFDPRLPKRVRVPRHKERVYSVSANGSPIQSSAMDIVLNVPIGNGESIQLLTSQMDSVDLSSLDETTLQGIRRLQSRLATLL